MSTAPSLGADVRHGLIWSTFSTLTLRIGSLLLGVVLARLLAPRDFGVYAVALSVQAVLLTLADFGLSADLVRSRDPAARAPTIATLGLATGLGLAAAMVAGAGPLASALGSPESEGVIALLSLTLVLAGAGVVPYAQMTRRFQQRRLFAVSAVDFATGTTVTLALIAMDGGVMSLAVGRVAAQAAGLITQFVLARERPRYGLDPLLIRPVLAFGVPVAAANVVSWLVIGAGNVVVASVAGPAVLGYYVVAWNISSWPMTGIGQVARSVALPAFARSQAAGDDPGRGLAAALALAWAVALPAGALLATLSALLIPTVYGTAWRGAVPVLVALGLFGATRVPFDVMASYLLSRGHAKAVLRLQLVWIAALLPALVIATDRFGAAGAGWSQLVVAVLVVFPAYLWALSQAGAGAAEVLAVFWPPVIAAMAAGVAGYLVAWSLDLSAGGQLGGGLVGVLLYAAGVVSWLRGRLSRAAQPLATTPDVTADVRALVPQ
jgi:O-antigen/teichoic acid export membrane protein